MNKNLFIIIGIGFVAVLLGVLFVPWLGRPEAKPGQYDLFAQCLSTKGVVMYGAIWCLHCQNEKKAFGNSFRFVNYVECPVNAKECSAKGVEGYPTWILSDGRKLVGEQGLGRLAEASGCALPMGDN